MTVTDVPAIGTSTTPHDLPGLDPDGVAAVSGALGLLVGGRTAQEALQLLESARGLMDQTSASLQLRYEVAQELHALLLMLQRGLPCGSQSAPTPQQQVLLREAAGLCLRVADEKRNSDDFWRFMALSLRAECLHLLGAGTEAIATAQLSLTALTKVESTNTILSVLLMRQAYNTALVHCHSATPPVTTLAFLDELQALLPAA